MNLHATLTAIARVQHNQNVMLTGDETWFNRSYPYYRRCYQEAVEMFDHLNDYWWKSSEFNAHQVKMEVVDIFHFLLAEAIASGAARHPDFSILAITEEISLSFENAFNAVEAGYVGGETYPVPAIEVVSTDSTSGSYDPFIIKAVEPFIMVCLKYSTKSLSRVKPTIDGDGEYGSIVRGQYADHLFEMQRKFAELSYHAGLSFKQLVFWYAAKYALNVFRKHYGYKEGTYRKTWNDREDNDYLLAIADKINVDQDFPHIVDAIIHELNLQYAETFPDLVEDGTIQPDASIMSLIQNQNIDPMIGVSVLTGDMVLAGDSEEDSPGSA